MAFQLLIGIEPVVQMYSNLTARLKILSFFMVCALASSITNVFAFTQYTEAEHVAGNSLVKTDATASNGTIVRGGTYYRLVQFEVDQLISEPVYLWIRYNTGEGGTILLRDNETNVLLQDPLTATAEGWHWLRMGPFSSTDAESYFYVSPIIRINGDVDTSYKHFKLDAFILSIEESLDPQAYFDSVHQEQEDQGTHSSIAAPQISSEITVDGTLVEPAWAEGLWVGPFLDDEGSGFANENTFFSLCYDTEHLYLGVRAYDSALSSGISTNVTQPDGPVWDDDSIELVIRSSTDTNVAFRILSNIIGTVYDEQQNGSVVNTTFNSGAVALGSISPEGYYELELSVPLSNLSLDPEENLFAKFNVSRHRAVTAQHSSWGGFNPTTHEPHDFGTIVFAEQVPAMQIHALDRFFQAQNDFNLKGLQTSPFSDMHVEFYRLEEDHIEVSQEMIFSLPQQTTSVPFTVDTSDLEVPFQYGLRLRDAQTSTLYYQSPIYDAKMVLELLHYDLEASSQITLLVNGATIDQGTAIKGVFGVVTGSNQVELHAQSPPSGVFSNSLFEIDVADSGWVVEPLASDPDITTTYMTFIAGMSRFNPRYRDYYTLAEELDMPMYLLVPGLKDYVLNNFQFFIEVPQSFEIKHATGYYGASEGHDVSLEQMEGGTPGTRRYQITFDDPVTFVEELDSFNVVQLIVNAGSAGGNYQREYAFDFWAEANDGNVRELIQRMPIRIVPFLQNQPLRRILAPVWSSRESSLNNSDHKYKLLSCYANTGFNDVLQTHEDGEDSLGLTSTFALHLDADDLGIVEFMNDHSGHTDPLLNYAGTDGVGNYSPLKLCPEIIRTDSEAHDLVKSSIIFLIQSRGFPERVAWDYEVDPFKWDPSHSYNCFGPRCLSRFRSKYRISNAVELNRDLLQQNFASRWSEFRALQASETASVFQESIEAVNLAHGLDISFSVHSGYGTDPSQYGWDWTYANDLGIRYAQCGYGRDLDKLQETINVIGPNIELVGGVIIGNYGLNNPEPVRSVSYSEVVQRVVDCGNVFLYVGHNLTGQTLSEVSKAFAMIGEYEDIIVDGIKDFDRVHAPGLKEDNQAVLYQDGQDYLAVIINSSTEELIVPVTIDGIPSGYNGLEYYSGAWVHTPQAFTAVLKPKSVFALSITGDTAESSPIVAYNDLSWVEGQLNHQITRYTTLSGSGTPSDGFSGQLVNYFTGLALNEMLTVTGGSWDGADDTTTGLLSDAQTDAAVVFNNFVDTEGAVRFGSSDLVLTFSGLDAHSLYNVTLFGNADSLYYSDRLTGITIEDAASFDNLSTPGASYESQSDPSVIFSTARNTAKGYVARFLNVDPGLDGSFMLRGFNQTTNKLPKCYLNAVKLERLSGALISDEDTDGLPDVWESRYFGTDYGLYAQGHDDYDNDGVTNGDEFIAGTNPTNQNDRLWVSVTSTNQQLKLTHPTRKAEDWVYRGVSRFYTLEQCNPANLPWEWTPVPGHEDVLGNNQEIRCVMDVEPVSYMYRTRVYLE